MNAPVKTPAVTFAEAFCKLQAEIKPAVKDTANGAFKGTKYADLGAVWEAIKQPLTNNGFAIIQSPDFDGQDMFLRTVVLHVSGDRMEGRYPLRPTKNDPQGYGSALTYARRYSISAMLGVIADDDDDGNAASAPAPKATPTPPKPADPDIQAGTRNWVDQQKELLLSFTDLDHMTAWLKKHASVGPREGNWDRPTPSSTLDKLLKFSAPMFNELKNYYLEKLREV